MKYSEKICIKSVFEKLGAPCLARVDCQTPLCCHQSLMVRLKEGRTHFSHWYLVILFADSLDGKRNCGNRYFLNQYKNKNNLKINFLKYTLSFHISETFFQNLKKKLNSVGTSPMNWFYKEK